MTEKWTESKMQNALTEPGNLFDYRRYASVPNVAWSVLDHGEADMICLSKGGFFHEVEIKISKSDLRADAKKHLGHQNSLVAYTWFAVPVELEAVALAELPERFGIVVVEQLPLKLGWSPMNRTRVARKAQRYRGVSSRKPGDNEINRFLRVGVLRMWATRHAAAKSKG